MHISLLPANCNWLVINLFIYFCICLAGKVLLQFCQCNLLSISQNVCGIIYKKTHIKLAETYFVIHMKWVTLLCSESLAAYSCPISKPFEVPCYHQTPHMQPWNPVKFIQFGFIEAFYSNRLLCKFLFVQELTDVINLMWLGWYLNFRMWFMNMVFFEQKKIKLWNKQHLVEKNTEIKQHALKMQ
jgi:hypothetical protein